MNDNHSVPFCQVKTCAAYEYQYESYTSWYMQYHTLTRTHLFYTITVNWWSVLCPIELFVGEQPNKGNSILLFSPWSPSKNHLFFPECQETASSVKISESLQGWHEWSPLLNEPTFRPRSELKHMKHMLKKCEEKFDLLRNKCCHLSAELEETD